jgi:hypothetical protein
MMLKIALNPLLSQQNPSRIPAIGVNPLLMPARTTEADVERQMHRLPHLRGDRVYRTRRTTRRDFQDRRRALLAEQVIERLPAEDEALHMAVCGRFALWDVVSAVLKLGACDIAELTIATLGFSRKNIDALCQLLDTGHISRASLLCSHYFSKTSTEIYDHAQAELSRRSTARFLSVRTHAKLLLIELADGRTVTVESSANLRSCKNIEQVSVIGDPQLYDFHRTWIDELFREGTR